ncbi:uncharacterized protein LOC113215432 [Frankliniella occidentalis]|uniref:Uncharacterized protein LOC113215432 n=1 Tax=Frankliniella occidentalis TaxID=133901 RepID=A0A6J1TDN5_FRAOC|nr:uncharacterized protein LOC113215432 [Frankliniella occidentalis]
MKCFWCKEELPANFLALDLHCQLKHKNGDIYFYTCREGCNRAYGSLDSLKKHLHKIHLIDFYPSVSTVHNVTYQRNLETYTSPEHLMQHEYQATETDMPEASHHSVEEVLEPFKKCVVSLLAKLSGDKTLPRSYVQKFIFDVTSLLKCTSSIALRVTEVMKSCKASPTDIEEVHKLFQFLLNPFEELQSEYRRLKYFKSTEAYIAPQPYEIGSIKVMRRSKGTVNLKRRPVYGQHVNLPLMLTKFFELPDAFSSTIAYVNSLDLNEDDYIYNYVQCPSFKAKAAKFKNAGEVVLPLFAFFDDLELNKDLSPHSKKIGAFYAKVACLTPEFQSALSNIFLCLLFLSKYRTADYETQKKILKPLIEDLTLLEKQGILVNIPNVGCRRIYFVTGLILGDNSGLNSLGGFVNSFSKANHMCRRCKVHKIVMHFQCVEDSALLRNEANFLAAVAVKNKSLTGVKDDCALREIPSLEFPQDLSVDPFHDCEEGICHNLMLAVLRKMIPKCFTLKTLNERINVFDYGHNVTNKVPPISEEFASRDKLKMSGSEMTCFIRLFSLIIGECVPESDPYWKLYLKFREVFDIVKAKALPKNIDGILNTLVSELNSDYCTLTGKNLTFKGHVLVHYGSFIHNNGPVDHVSTIRYEAKHRDITKPAHVNSSRTDICLSSAIKHQLAFCYKFLAAESILPQTSFGSLDLTDISDVDALSGIHHLIPSDFLCNGSECLSCVWINLKGTKYVHGCVLFVNLMENSKPVFGQLEQILLSSSNQSDILFVFSYFVNSGFDSHFHAYHVSPTSPLRYSIIRPSDIFDPMPLHAHKVAFGELYIPLKYRF